jgi:hypothetical protein
MWNFTAGPGDTGRHMNGSVTTLSTFFLDRYREVNPR